MRISSEIFILLSFDLADLPSDAVVSLLIRVITRSLLINIQSTDVERFK